MFIKSRYPPRAACTKPITKKAGIRKGTGLFQKFPLFRRIAQTLSGVSIIFDYSPLWKTMERMQVSQYQLLKGGIDNKTLDSLKKGKNITMVTLEKLCRIIGCTPNDIVEFQ